MEAVYLLNRNYEFHRKLDWKQAVQMLYRKSQPVEVLLYSDIEIRPGIYAPKVLKLHKDIRKFYGKKVHWSPDNCFTRDDYTCQYCGTKLPKGECTVDHVMPQSRGGKTDFDNCVTACHPCNNLKDNRTPREAHLTLLKLPYTPTIQEFFRKKVKQEGVYETLKELGVY